MKIESLIENTAIETDRTNYKISRGAIAFWQGLRRAELLKV
jgi:hypothetical protein